jgi:lipoate-protein ligase B
MDLETRRTCVGEPWTYAALDLRQREVARRVRDGGPGAILLSEVDPVITTGRRTPATDLLAPRAPVYRVDRGGLATYHGPGQWVLFPVDHLERLTGDRRGVRLAVEGLLGAALEVCRKYHSDAECRGGAETGIWSEQGKLASVGIHIEEGVLLHGLSLNVYRTPESFLGLRPCGLEPRMGYLFEAEAGQQAFTNIGKALVSAVLARFWQLDLARAERYTQRSIYPIP